MGTSTLAVLASMIAISYMGLGGAVTVQGDTDSYREMGSNIFKRSVAVVDGV